MQDEHARVLGNKNKGTLVKRLFCFSMPACLPASIWLVTGICGEHPLVME